ncbi:Uncharacterised protein [Mammaliicoccus lentus]|uniref:hypothetical protein n=1 Tax=Mammaliicoccus lentus TaxID=42858 RepID=UPI00085C9E3E|nr:hypothetical protein [Mammaliicoccus lentus]SCU00022.1 Uncharacterised protein [Mammaliicoccus lentus]
MRRVKFYSKGDLSVGGYLNNVTELISGFKKEQLDDINKVLELYNCTKFIDNKLYHKDWSENYISNLKGQSKQVMSNIAKKFSRINEMNLTDIVSQIDNMYKEDFLELFSKFKLTERINDNQIKSILKSGYLHINQICKHKNLVFSYTDIIREELISDPINIELLLDEFVVLNRNQEREKMYIPNNLTKEDIHLLIDDYIKHPKANLNYLELIRNNKNDDKFTVTEKQRWKAKKKIDEKEEELFKGNSGIPINYQLKLDSDVKNIVDYHIDGFESTIIIDRNYLKNTLDYPSILNNFIWLFSFVDMNGRASFVSKENYGELHFFDLFSISSKKDYNNNLNFKISEQYGHLIMGMYYNFLKSNDIYLESVIKWFFEEYLKDELEVIQYTFETPNQLSSYREKCRDILAEFDYSLQQYKCYVDYGEINHEMLGLSSSGISFDNVPSKIENKYAYPKESLNTIFHFLFSDQSNLGYLGETENSKSTFYELINDEAVSYNDFQEHQKSHLDYIFDKGYIMIDANGYIQWTDKQELFVLKSLFDYGVINFKRLPQNMQNQLLQLKKEGHIYFQSSLFTQQEQDLLDFYLNNSKFQNGPQIRNKYLHGRQGNKDENLNFNNYLIILRLIVLVVIKINDDLTL